MTKWTREAAGSYFADTRHGRWTIERCWWGETDWSDAEYGWFVTSPDGETGEVNRTLADAKEEAAEGLAFAERTT